MYCFDNNLVLMWLDFAFSDIWLDYHIKRNAEILYSSSKYFWDFMHMFQNCRWIHIHSHDWPGHTELLVGVSILTACVFLQCEGNWRPKSNSLKRNKGGWVLIIVELLSRTKSFNRFPFSIAATLFSWTVNWGKSLLPCCSVSQDPSLR